MSSDSRRSRYSCAKALAVVADQGQFLRKVRDQIELQGCERTGF